MGQEQTITVQPSRPRMEPRAGETLRLGAPAKVNLNLLVGPRREDGFHPLDSYVAKITLYDRIDLICRQDGHLHLKTAGADCGEPEENLVLRAAKLLRGDLGTDSDFKRRNRTQSPNLPAISNGEIGLSPQ